MLEASAAAAAAAAAAAVDCPLPVSFTGVDPAVRLVCSREDLLGELRSGALARSSSMMSLVELSSTTSWVVSDCCSMREHNCTYFCCISASCSCIERSCDLSTSFSTRFWWMCGVATVSTRSSSSSVVAGSVFAVAAAAAAAAAALLLSMKFCSVRPRFNPAAAAAAYRSAALLSCCCGW
uniref:Uncharacterized protein n=1 Tax=Anopheles darlingi TaxID=43151 RepID=A0A2M4D9L6_ANODA